MGPGIELRSSCLVAALYLVSHFIISLCFDFSEYSRADLLSKSREILFKQLGPSLSLTFLFEGFMCECFACMCLCASRECLVPWEAEEGV